MKKNQIILFVTSLVCFCFRGNAQESNVVKTVTLIFYHYSHHKNFKHYYQEYVCKDLKKDFSVLVSYDRFIKYIPMAFLPMIRFHLFRCKLSIRTNNYFIDSTKIVACHPKRAH